MPDQPRTAASVAQPPESAFATLTRGRAMRAFDLGVIAALGVALVLGLLWGVVLLQWGLIAVGIMSGWLVGRAVGYGAWRGVSHPRTRRIQALGAVLGVAGWFGAAWVAYLSSRAILESERTFAERLADLSFAQYMNQQYEAAGLIHAVTLAAMAIMGWRSAR